MRTRFIKHWHHVLFSSPQSPLLPGIRCGRVGWLQPRIGGDTQQALCWVKCGMVPPASTTQQVFSPGSPCRWEEGGRRTQWLPQGHTRNRSMTGLETEPRCPRPSPDGPIKVFSCSVVALVRTRGQDHSSFHHVGLVQVP